MKQYKFYTLMMATLMAAACATEKENAGDDIAAPVAEKQPKELVMHGNTRVDNYFWLRLSDEQKNAEQKDDQTQKVISYLTAENDYLKAKMKGTEALQKKLYDEMVGRIKQTDESVPYKRNGYWYYTRYEAKNIQSIAAKKAAWRLPKK
jgi:oligopeptidase B